MTQDHTVIGRRKGWLGAVLACGFVLGLPGAALAGPGMKEDHPHDNKGESGGCSACGSGGGYDAAAIRDARDRAGDASERNSGGPSITGRRGGGGDQSLGGAITQLGEAEAKAGDGLTRSEREYLENLTLLDLLTDKAAGKDVDMNEPIGVPIGPSRNDILGWKDDPAPAGNSPQTGTPASASGGEDMMNFLNKQTDKMSRPTGSGQGAPPAASGGEDMMNFLNKQTDKMSRPTGSGQGASPAAGSTPPSDSPPSATSPPDNPAPPEPTPQAPEPVPSATAEPSPPPPQQPADDDDLDGFRSFDRRQ